MAPKIKISCDEIITASIQITREQGVEAINARSVAAKLNCSIQPIFRTFGTMEDLKAAVYKRAEEIHNTAMIEAIKNGEGGFLDIGLFMSDAFNQESSADIAGSTTGDDKVIALISGMTGLDASKSQELLTGIWFTVHGMASLLATNSCSLNDEKQGVC